MTKTFCDVCGSENDVVEMIFQETGKNGYNYDPKDLCAVCREKISAFIEGISEGITAEPNK